ncbi:unnamed protein product [Cyprideis torosa]|uniref:NEDD8-activating enzyme E1 regulatory subunit n=1 Tax=Cyprideis torosa TaxID=163714 RepID=A0A7R8W5A3_9CRUS|nr:unnamed protein product [Cyprideis torosa]CAG0884031.1 unnamed protein product [Cyprideis torosa]
MSGTTPSPKSPQEVSERSRKYDRQLRLWGDHGQAALEEAKVCLLNATATGTEALKSLVLPGVGYFTIVDGTPCSASDLGNNFFVSAPASPSEQDNRNRGEVACALLEELNPDSSGHFVDLSPESVLSENPDFFNNFSLVIATDLKEQSLKELSELLWEKKIPLLVACSYGFWGHLRLQISEHVILESHPDAEISDVRLLNQFPTLEKHLSSFTWHGLDKKQHSHVPALIIVATALKVFRDTHDGATPCNRSERNEIIKIINSMRWREGGSGRRDSESTDSGGEENFDEAVRFVNTWLSPHPDIPPSVQEVFDDPQCININQSSSSFWLMAHALRQFVLAEGGGCLPVRGSLPDMTSDSKSYISLQNIYRARAAKDTEIVAGYLRSALEKIGRSPPQGTEEGSPGRPASRGEDRWNRDFPKDESMLSRFCRNARFIRVQRGTKISDELDGQIATNVNDLSGELESGPTETLLSHYLLLRAASKFRETFGAYPGAIQTPEGELGHLKTCLARVLSALSFSSGHPLEEHLLELARFGGAEIHSVAAFIGGCAAHEAIKVITKQYVPIDNTVLYNAVNGAVGSYKF